MNNTYYFSHDGNARSDAKIAGLLAECGWEGYGIYWMLIECMFEDSDTQIKYKHIHALSFTERVNEELLRRVIAIGIEQELFVSDGDSFWSNGLRDRKDYFVSSRNQKSAAGKKGMENRWKNHVPVDKNITVLSENDNGVNNGVIENHNNKKKRKDNKRNEIKEIVDYMNGKIGSAYKDTALGTVSHINARLSEGYSVEDFKKVIDVKTDEWKDDVVYSKFLRPDTLFSGKFDGYLNQAGMNNKSTGNVQKLESGGFKLKI